MKKKKVFLNQRLSLVLLQNKAKAVRQLNMAYVNYLRSNQLTEAQVIKNIKDNVKLIRSWNKGREWR